MSQFNKHETKPEPRLRLVRPEPIRFEPATEWRGPRVLVVAEIGVNHDGSVPRALQLVDAAARAGADVVKLQLFDPRRLLSRQAVLAEYQKRDDTSVFDMLDRLKLSVGDMTVIRNATRRAGLSFMVTPFSLEDVEDTEQLDVDAVKIASPDVVNMPLLSRAAALGKPMIVSTGTADLAEIEAAALLLASSELCFLHCVSSYPTPTEAIALNGMRAIEERFHLPVGYSDHSTELLTGAMAVTAGACVIEKHLTWDRKAPGPDHFASFDPVQFQQYVKLIRQAESMTGPIRKQATEVEQEVRRISRQSVCLTRDLPAGHVLTPHDLTVKRPGTGVPAASLDDVIGLRLAQAVRGNDLLTFDDLEDYQAKRCAS